MSGHRGLRLVFSLLLATFLVLNVQQASASGRPRWVASWAASPVVGSVIPWSDCPAGTGLTDQTVRNVVFVSAGGGLVRVRLTNAFGATPLEVGHASVAVQSAGAGAVPGTVRELRFHGRRGVTVPAGRELFSDPVALRVAALSTLLVSVYVPGSTGPVTNHPFTAQGNFLAAGDRAVDVAGADYGNTPCWMLADGVDVVPNRPVVGSVVALGDSITDTSATTGNANHRWPDFLARRLNALPGPTLSVVNAGLGGNRVLLPREGEPYYGIPAVDRLDRDVFAQTGVRTVILLEGVNDIGFDASAPDLIAGLRFIADRTHAAGLRIVGATITPFGGSFIETPSRNQTWATVNDWIRHSGTFDAVVDFAAATAAPGNPMALNPAYDSGDHLHPNDAGTEAMAAAIDLSALFPHHLAVAG
ncbi:SGNH/GDSL hydrolase family protein [Actinophytocola sp.]|uniref:SGNH/GDSL hydrolase family protein n=1 Tax=Actinophytocola sp. TaxID=1872138 RepID=UPI003899F628